MLGKSAAVAKDTTNVHHYVGQQIKKLREERGMSPLSFSGICGVNPVWLTQREAGAATCLFRIQQIAKGAGVEVEYFFPNAEIPDDYPDH